MTDKLEQDIARAKRAELLLADETLTEAFSGLEDAFIAEWKVSPVRDTVARERLWQAVNIVGLVRTQLANYVGNGKVAQAELDQLAGRRPKIFGIV